MLNYSLRSSSYTRVFVLFFMRGVSAIIFEWKIGKAGRVGGVLCNNPSPPTHSRAVFNIWGESVTRAKLFTERVFRCFITQQYPIFIREATRGGGALGEF